MQLFAKSALGTEPRFDWIIDSSYIGDLEESYAQWYDYNAVGNNGGAFFTIDGSDLTAYENQTAQALINSRKNAKLDAEDVGWLGRILLNIAEDMDREKCAVLLGMIQEGFGLGEMMGWIEEEDYTNAVASEDIDVVFDTLAEANEPVPEWLEEYIDRTAIMKEHSSIVEVELAGAHYWVFLDN